jgi:myosin heavy subunit
MTLQSAPRPLLHTTQDNDDLATLSALDTELLLKSLRDRYAADKIYVQSWIWFFGVELSFSSAQTYVGDILIAVNPYKRIPLYGPEVCLPVSHGGVGLMIWLTQVQSRYTSGTKGANAPHLYYLAFSAYEAMLRTKKSQCFVIRSVMHLCFFP